MRTAETRGVRWRDSDVGDSDVGQRTPAGQTLTQAGFRAPNEGTTSIVADRRRA